MCDASFSPVGYQALVATALVDIGRDLARVINPEPVGPEVTINVDYGTLALLLLR